MKLQTIRTDKAVIENDSLNLLLYNTFSNWKETVLNATENRFINFKR